MDSIQQTVKIDSPKDGGLGGRPAPLSSGAVLEQLNDKRLRRGAMRDLRAAITRGQIRYFDLPAEAATEVPEKLMDLLREHAALGGDGRVAVGAAATLLKCGEFNLRLAEAVDKSERLDAGDPTENHDHTLNVGIVTVPDRVRPSA